MTHSPVHRRPGAMALVAVGGAAGALARAGVAQIGHHTWWATACVNMIGAFVLGTLLEHLTRTGERLPLRLVAGTGFCGAFTTYSTFAHDAVGRGGLGGVTLVVGEVILGLIAAALGAATATVASCSHTARATTSRTGSGSR